MDVLHDLVLVWRWLYQTIYLLQYGIFVASTVTHTEPLFDEFIYFGDV